MRLKVLNKNFDLRLLLFLLCLCRDVIPKNAYKSGEVRANPKGCIYLRCKRGNQCVNRRFWCKNPPCPNMLYCTKSRMESLKGPSSCESVRCSKGFVCLLRVRDCQWGEPCQQHIARCVSEQEYYDSPASCVDFECPSGLRCILRESLCAKPPCKLVKSCANTEDVISWYESCKSLGCLSEHECFLRRSTRYCRIYPCNHTPDCSAKNEEELEANEHCRGWVCPKGEECSTLSQGTCKRDSCEISRSCHRPLMVPINVPSAPKHSWRDDVKLSFYSKVHKNLSTSEVHHSNSDLSGNNKSLQGDVVEDKKIKMNSTIGKFYDFPIPKLPNYVSPKSRPTSSRTLSVSPDLISGRVVQPTVTSLSSWLNHLKLKTGVDAIESWIEKAENQENYAEFIEWLESVKDMLGPDAYNLWLEEVRTMTVMSPAFQRWLPPIPTAVVPQPSVSPDFVESVRNSANGNYQDLSVSPKPINYRNDEDNSYPHHGMINTGLKNISMMKNDDHNEESYIFPPKNNTMLMKSEITTETPVTSLSVIPLSSTAVPIIEWQQFDDRDPRLFEQAYPIQRNFENVPWSNQALMFQGFDTVNPMELQQPPDIDPRFLNPGVGQGQFSPVMNPQFNRGSIDPRLLQSSEIPDQQIQTNWSFQQPSDKDLNSLFPNSLSDQFIVPINPQRDQFILPINPQRDQFIVPINPQRDEFIVPINPQRNQFSMDRRFLVPGEELEQQVQSGWSVPARNPYFSHPHTSWSQLGPSLNSLQQDSMDQTFLEPEEFPQHQLQTNWSSQPSLNINPNFFRNANWREKLFSPPNSESPQERDFRRLFNQRNIESLKMSRSNADQGNKEADKAYSNNSTRENISWMKYFLDKISQKYVTPENIGTVPTNGAKFAYGGWPESSDRRRSLVNVPYVRTKPKDSTHVNVQFHYDDKDAERSRETSPELFEVPGFYPEFPWLMDPRLYGYYLHLRGRDSKTLYEKNNREVPPVQSSPSRTHRAQADTRSPLPKPFFSNSQREALRLKYDWPNTYLHDRLYGMAEPRPLPLSTAQRRPAIAIREYDEHPDTFLKINRPEVIGDRKIDFVYRDREFYAPGQPMAVPDLWSSRFRTPLSSVFQKFDKERLGHRNLAQQKRPISTTIAPPVISTSSVAPQQVLPLKDEYSKGLEVKDYQEVIRDDENYDDSGIYPLLLSLQGYIETSKEDEAKNNELTFKNSTILPVYKVEDGADEEEDYRNDYQASRDNITDPPSNSDDQVINLFKNKNYGGVPDFPKNLKSVFDVEAAMVMKNTTGESNVKIKDIKWDYENNVEDTFVDDPSRFIIQSQGSFISSNEHSNIKEARGWDGSSSVSRDEDETEKDSYDDVIDYEDKTILDDRSNYNFQPVNTDDSLENEEIFEELIDSFYDDRDHKRFKKNRP